MQIWLFSYELYKKTEVDVFTENINYIMLLYNNYIVIHCESKKLGHFYFYCNFVKPEIISAVI